MFVKLQPSQEQRKQRTPIDTVWHPLCLPAKMEKSDNTVMHSGQLNHSSLHINWANQSPFFILTSSGTLVWWQLNKILMIKFYWVSSAACHIKISEKSGQYMALLHSQVKFQKYFVHPNASRLPVALNCRHIHICDVFLIRVEGWLQQRGKTWPDFIATVQWTQTTKAIINLL